MPLRRFALFLNLSRTKTDEVRASREMWTRAIREWEEANPDVAYDPDLFRREILPGLASVKLADIMAAAGISKGYASNVRAGKFTPHVSTWGALARLVGAWKS